MLKAVIFDLDGLLVDSTPVQQEANRQFLAKYGKVHFPSTGREGMRIIDIIRDYKDIYQLPGTVEELYVARQELFLSLVKTDLQLFPGALPLLEKLKNGRRLKIALATSGSKDYIRTLFSKFETLESFFHVVATGDDVVRGKPYPDIYLLTLEKLGFEAEECIVLEDSFNGIAAAKAAGIQVICVPNKNYQDADYSQADKTFASLVEVGVAIPS